jgi:hypothetical protein
MLRRVLHYEKASGRRRLVKRASWVLAGVAVIVITSFTWHHRERIIAQFEAVRHQRIIANHRVPADRVLYESPELDDSTEAMMQELRRVIAGQPPYSERFEAYVAAPGTVPYMGIRATPSGKQRIVIVDQLFLHVLSSSDGYGALVSYEIHEPGTYLKLPRQITSAGSGGGVGVSHRTGPPGYPALIVYAGQPDPADPTRVNFRFVSGGREGVYVLRLDDADDLDGDLEFAEPDASPGR